MPTDLLEVVFGRAGGRLTSWRGLVQKLVFDGIDAPPVSRLLDTDNLELGERLHFLVADWVYERGDSGAEGGGDEDARLLDRFKELLDELKWRRENDIWI